MQTSSGCRPIGELWNSIQSWLFPVLEDEIGELDEKHRQFVAVCELCATQDYMAAYQWIGNGCPPSDRLALCKAYIAKAVWDFATTRDLIDSIRHRPALRRVCGWETLGEVPSEATFSRAYGAFFAKRRDFGKPGFESPDGRSVPRNGDFRPLTRPDTANRARTHLFHLQNPSWRVPQAGDARGFVKTSD